MNFMDYNPGKILQMLLASDPMRGERTRNPACNLERAAVIFLSLIQCSIGSAQQVWSIARMDGKDGDAAGDAEFQPLPIGQLVFQFLHPFDDLFRHHLRR